MRVKTMISTLLVAGIGLALSACYVAPGPGYAYGDPGYSGYYGAPAYYGGPAYYGPSVGVYYGGGGGWRSGGWRGGGWR
jgi:hypothetical protein